MRKFTLLVFLSVLFTGFTFAQESMLKAKSKHLTKETNTSLIENSTSRVNLQVLNKANKSTQFYEGFETSPNASEGLLPEGWTQKRTSTLDAAPTADPDPELPSWFRQENGVYGLDGDYVHAGLGSMATGYTTPEFTWAISPEFTMEGSATDLAFLTYWVWYQHSADDGWFTNYHVKVFADGAWTLLQSFIGADDPTANLFEASVGIDVSAYIGKTIQLAFIYEYTDGYQMAIDEIEVAVLPNFDNGINSVFYEFYQWWPASVDKQMRFDIEVGGKGLAPGIGEVSLFVNDQLIETQELEIMLFGMSDVDTFLWTPDAPGIYNLRFQLSDELDDGDGNMVADENPANNILELTFDIPDPETVLFTEGFEHVDWENPDGATVIFPPSDEWLITEGWGVTTARAMRDLVSASVGQFNNDPEEVMVTPAMSLPAGTVKLNMIVGGLNNGIIDDGSYLGHSTLEIYLLDEAPAKDVSEATLLLTYELDSLVGDAARTISLDIPVETAGDYYLSFNTTSTFNFTDFFSFVFIDNIMLTSIPEVVMYDVTFNVDVTNLEGFDPETHTVYMTGNIVGWAEPGTEGSVTMTRDADNTEAIVYTTTVSLEENTEVAYKYFSDAVAAGWNGGEWAGEPNREVTITEATTFNDTWAVYGNVSVDEVTEDQNFSVYPNPVRDNLTIGNGQNISSVRIFDITGKVVYNANINDVTTIINVSDFNEGVYVVQIISGNEVTSRKINIVK